MPLPRSTRKRAVRKPAAKKTKSVETAITDASAVEITESRQTIDTPVTEVAIESPKPVVTEPIVKLDMAAASRTWLNSPDAVSMIHQRAPREHHRAKAVMFDALGFASYNEFIALKSGYGKDFSKLRNIQGGAGLGLQILPGRPWSGRTPLHRAA